MAQVMIEPDGIETEVPDRSPLVRALGQAGVAVETPCGGFGICGKCKVRFVDGKTPQPTDEELRHLTNSDLVDGWRLACRHRLEGDAVIFVPEVSRLTIAQILTTAVERQTKLQPAVRRFVAQVEAPSVSDERSDAQRLLKALQTQHGVDLSPSAIPLSVLRSLPAVLRQSNFCITVILHQAVSGQPLLLSVEQATSDTPPRTQHPAPSTPLLGIAFDIGTTTLVGYLLDLETGEELSHAARLNPQVQFGDDVVSRLCFVMQQQGGLRQLQQAVVRGLNEIVAECCQEANVEPKSIYETVAVGNTAMLHLFLGVNPEPIALAPYVSVFNEPVTVEAWRLGLRLHPNAMLTTLPCVAGYIGADTVAVALTHLWEPEGETVVALDIGTNGEVVVRHQGQYLCASAAAGPAFEGGRIYQGMRAEKGAIAKVELESDGDVRWLRVGTIGGAMPKGLCGSGLIDAVAALLKIGILDGSGRLTDEAADWQKQFINLNGQKAFRLVNPEASELSEGIVLTQRDIRELQLAKGSIRAVTEALLKTVGLDWSGVERVYVAGAFGMFVNLQSAQRIGLLPSLTPERFQAVGNAAGAGAKLALRSVTERKHAFELSQRMKHIPMTGNPRYEGALMEFISFPSRPYP